MLRGLLVVCALLLITIPASSAALCNREIEIPNDCGILNLGCNLNALLSGLLCWGNPLALTLRVTAGTYSLALTSTNLYSLTVTTSGNGVIILNLNADLTLVQNLVISGAGALFVPVGMLVNVLGNLIVQTGATLRIGGNVIVSGITSVYGTLQLNGTKTHGSGQNAWLTSNLVQVSNAAPSTPAMIKGNGGIVGNVVCGNNAILSAGNSPGIIYIDGSLQLSSSTNMIIEVESPASFDAYFVTRLFTRGSGKATLNFAPGYTPNPSDRFVFVTHSNATGFFSTVTGNLNNLLSTFGGRSTSVIYDDIVVPAYCVSSCTPMETEQSR